MALLFCLEAFEYVKKTHFIENNEIGFEPFCGLLSVTDGSLMDIGYLFAASIVNGGPGPGFLAPWVYHYNYIIGGLDSISSFLPSRADDRTLYSTANNEVRTNLRNTVGKFLFSTLY